MSFAVADMLDEWLSTLDRNIRIETSFEPWYDALSDDIKKWVRVESLPIPTIPTPTPVPVTEPRAFLQIPFRYKKLTNEYEIENFGIKYALTGDCATKLDRWVNRSHKPLRQKIEYRLFLDRLSGPEKAQINAAHISDGKRPIWLELQQKEMPNPYQF